jgi:hypothetical protein
MIRILIREVVESRHRTPKSIGIAEIEPTLELPLRPGETPRDYTVRIFHAPPHDRQVRFQARVPAPAGARPECWELLREGLNRFFRAQQSAADLPAKTP